MSIKKVKKNIKKSLNSIFYCRIVVFIKSINGIKNIMSKKQQNPRNKEKISNISCRVTVAEKKKILARAKRAGMKISRYVLHRSITDDEVNMELVNDIKKLKIELENIKEELKKFKKESMVARRLAEKAMMVTKYFNEIESIFSEIDVEQREVIIDIYQERIIDEIQNEWNAIDKKYKIIKDKISKE